MKGKGIEKLVEDAKRDGRVKEGRLLGDVLADTPRVTGRSPGAPGAMFDLAAEQLRPLPAERLSETEFQNRVMLLAKAGLWRVVHMRKVRVQRADGSVYYQTPFSGDGKGFPDLFFARPHCGTLHAELKVGKNQAIPEQLRWLEDLRAAGAAAYLWRPEDWDEVVAVLRTGEPPPPRKSSGRTGS